MAALALARLYTLRPGQNMRLNVCSWHKAEMPVRSLDVRFGGEPTSTSDCAIL